MRSLTQKKREDQRAFIAELASFLVKSQAWKSVKLQMQDPFAKEWASLRAKSPVRGYPTIEQATWELSKFFGVPVKRKETTKCVES